MSVHVHVTNLFVVVWWISMSFCSPYSMWLWNFSPSSGQDCKHWLSSIMRYAWHCFQGADARTPFGLRKIHPLAVESQSPESHRMLDVTNMSPICHHLSGKTHQDTKIQDPLAALKQVISKTLRHSVMNFWHILIILARHADSAVAETSAAKIPSCNLHPRRFRGKAAIGNLQERN